MPLIIRRIICTLGWMLVAWFAWGLLLYTLMVPFTERPHTPAWVDIYLLIVAIIGVIGWATTLIGVAINGLRGRLPGTRRRQPAVA
jgi:hypothetical protein